MFHHLTVIACALLLLSVPFNSALASYCECAHEEPGETSLSTIPCCEIETFQCCYETHSDSEHAHELLAELPNSIRLPQPEFVEVTSPVLPVEISAQGADILPRSADPPDLQNQKLSFRQSWLI